jgi:glucokinase
MSSEDGFIGGIDLGGTKILSVCVDRDLRILAQDYRETGADDGPDAVIERMVDSMRAAVGSRRLLAVGVSTPGPTDPTRGIVTTPPNLPGWRDVPLASAISERLGVPAWIENDANAAALAEHRLGAGSEAKHVILVALGTGIGGGLVLNGQLYRGASGAAGEIGHMQLDPDGRQCGCGRRGCLEALASGWALGARAAEIVALEPDGILARLVQDSGEEPDAKRLEDAAAAGDKSAQAAIHDAGTYLGAGLVNIVNIFDPEVIVIGGGLRRLGEPYLGHAIEIMKSEAFPQNVRDVQVVEAALGDEAPALGVAILAIEMLQSQAKSAGQ